MLDYDIEQICRVCLKTDFDLFLLFDEENAIEGVFLSEMISEITIFKVRRHDDFPHQICLDCMQRVRRAYELKKQFENSHRTLLKYLEAINKTTIDLKPEQPNDKVTQTEDSTFHPCEKCDEKFLTERSLRNHREEAHKGSANICRFCNKIFMRIGDLKSHIARHHPDVQHFNPHECLVCHRRFTRKHHVIRHMATIHKIENPQNQKSLSGEEDNSTNKVDIVDEEETTLELLKKQEESLLSTNQGSANLSGKDDQQEFDDSDDACSGVADPDPLSSDDDDDKPLADLRNSLNVKSEGLEEISIKEELDETPTSFESSLPQLGPTEPDVKDVLETIKTEIETNETPPNDETTPTDDSTERKFKCTTCEKSFKRSHHLKRHMMAHDKPFKCSFCDSRFGRADHLKCHMSKHENHRGFKCEFCDKTFNRSDFLRQHKSRKHNIDGTEFKSESCSLCNKKFSSKAYLQKHMKMHSNKVWKCKLCEIGFETKEALKEHNKSHAKEKPFLCSECGISFLRNDYLLIHMRRHTGEKPYKCKYCDKGFPRATDLNVHVKYHTGEKTHLCTICGKGFQRSYNLIVHMRVHTGERPYKCPHCPKDFAQGNDLKAHIRRHTGERFKCKICGDGFIQAYHLTQHNIDVHGIADTVRKGRLEKVKSLPKPSSGGVSSEELTVTQ